MSCLRVTTAGTIGLDTEHTKRNRIRLAQVWKGIDLLWKLHAVREPTVLVRHAR